MLQKQSNVALYHLLSLLPSKASVLKPALFFYRVMRPASVARWVSEAKSKSIPKKEPVVQQSLPTPASTYRPSYIPPEPVAIPTKKKTVLKIDTSKVVSGSLVSHKAFGTGQVVGIDGGLIIVDFKGVKKKFQFPGAFEQGFLKAND